ncbi:MAG TPA: hypothetical protein VF447_01650 [Terriglobales bacterium]
MSRTTISPNRRISVLSFRAPAVRKNLPMEATPRNRTRTGRLLDVVLIVMILVAITGMAYVFTHQ